MPRTTGCPHCPHCQQAETIHASDNIALIKAENTRLLGLILQLRHDRSAVLQHLNTLCSATRKLPHEILSLILRYASPPMDITSRDLRLYHEETYSDPRETYRPLRLGTVCSQWHRTVRSTPQLWTSLVLDVRNAKEVLPKICILQTYLRYVGNQSFSLELNINGKELPARVMKGRGNGSRKHRSHGHAPLNQLYTIIFTPENSRRIRVLRLSDPPPTLSVFSFHNFPRLEEFRLGSDCNTIVIPRTIVDFQSPHCKRFIAKNTSLSLSPKDMPLSQNMTVVNLFRVPNCDCFDLLLLFPNLVEFYARYSLYTPDPLDGLSQVANQTFTLSKLEVFEWTCQDNVWNTALLENALFPALRTLCWGGNQAHLDQNQLVAFFGRLPQTLNELEIVGVQRADNDARFDWDQYEQLFVNVRKLSLRQCSLHFASDTVHKLGNVNLLPSLEELSLVEEPLPRIEDDDEPTDEANELDYNAILRVRLSSVVVLRFRPSGIRFRFSTVDRNLNWGSRDEKRVLGYFGSNLEIFENGTCLEMPSDLGDEEDLHGSDVGIEDPLPDNTDESTSEDDISIEEGEEELGDYGELYPDDDESED